MSTKKQVAIVVLFASIVVILFFGWLFLYAIPNHEHYEEEVQFVKSLDWNPENSTVSYSSFFAKESVSEWKNFFVWIRYEDQPWNNTRGYIWYTDYGEYYFEEKIVLVE
jgi:hypothetical protein